MHKKENLLKDIKSGNNIRISLMVMKIIARDAGKVICPFFLHDKA